MRWKLWEYEFAHWRYEKRPPLNTFSLLPRIAQPITIFFRQVWQKTILDSFFETLIDPDSVSFLSRLFELAPFVVPAELLYTTILP